MKQALFLILIVTIVMGSCNYSDEPIAIKTDVGLNLELPAYLKKTNRLSKDAVLQYENKFRTFYTLLVKEDGNDPQVALQTATDQLKGVLRKPVVETFSPENDHFGFSSQKVTGFIDDENFVYFIAIFAHENQLYQLVVWTKREKMDSFGTDIENVYKSLHVQ